MKQRAMLGGELLNPTDYWHNLELDEPAVLTIAGVAREDLWREGQRNPDRKPVVSFVGTSKKLVLNRTNEDTLVGMFGADAEKWKGNKIELYRGTTRVGSNKNEPCIRVRAPSNAVESEAPAEKPKPTTLGTAAARKLIEKMQDARLGMDALRADIGAPNTPPDQWPRELGAKIKEWLEGRIGQ